MQNRAVMAADANKLKEMIGLHRDSGLADRRERILASVGLAREEDADEALVSVLKTGTLRPFSRMKKVQFAAAGTPSTVVAFNSSTYQPTPFPYGKTEQPVDDGILVVDQIAVEFPTTLKANTLDAIRRAYGVKIHYPGKKGARTIPLADIMEAGGVQSIDAGNNSGTAVAATHKGVSPARGLLGLREDERLIILPKESQVRVELALINGESAPTLTGETANLFAYWTFRGERHSTNHETH